jgi:hypothetical protein
MHALQFMLLCYNVIVCYLASPVGPYRSVTVYKDGSDVSCSTIAFGCGHILILFSL